MSLEVVALGARTPVGLTAETSAAAVRAGVAWMREFPFLDSIGDLVVVACDEYLHPSLRAPARIMALGKSVLDEVVAKLGARARSSASLRIWVALPEVRPGFADTDAIAVINALADHLSAAHVLAEIELVGRGHAGAMLGVTRALEAEAQGDDGPFVILGADSLIDDNSFYWLEGMRLFGQPQFRSSFIPGEGAGALVLASDRAGLPSLARVLGIATAHEALDRTSDTGSLGAAMTEALFEATRSLEGRKIDTPYVDLNGERYRTEEWGFVALRGSSLWSSLEYEMPSEYWGDVGAAWTPLATTLAARAWARDHARGPVALVLAGSIAGLRGALLLKDPRSS